MIKCQKYKEITRSFRFFNELNIKSLPKYVTDYILENEKILSAWATRKDTGVWTNKKIILYDRLGLGNNKQIYIIPYKSISTISIMFKSASAHLIIYMDCGYPTKLTFINLSPEDKTKLRILYTNISDVIINK